MARIATLVAVSAAMAFLMAPAHAEVITIDGTIKSVDVTTRTITVEVDGKAKTLDVSRKAKVSFGGKATALDSLSSGQKVILSYHDDLEIVLKIEAVQAKQHQDPVKTNSIGMQFKLLPGGTFRMGSNSGESDERPAHQVTLTQPFYMGVHEVTQKQYFRVMGVNPSEFKGRSNPVEMVTWVDVVKFCRKLTSLPKEKAVGRVYRLPTEAEWEYACRAGTNTAYSFGDDYSKLGAYVWFNDNSGKTTHPVGQKRANAWGLYDMHGNVYEWCADWYGDYPSGAVTDPRGPRSGSIRVRRGGGWDDGVGGYCRSANRSRNSPDRRINNLGFRLVLSPCNVGTKSQTISLFDGKSLEGWRTLDSEETFGWEVRNGELRTAVMKDVPLLFTKDVFDDFEFNCEFWLDKKADSGIFLRGRYELQLLDDPEYPQAKVKKRCGSIVGQLAPTKAMYRGARKWNDLTVRMESKTVTVVFNNETVIERRYISDVTPGAIDDLKNEPGPIALQHFGSLVRFRNLSIRPLIK